MKQMQSRKQFLSRTALAAGAAWTAPRFSIGSPGESANEKLNVAVVGVGGMGRYAVEEAAKQNLVAFCDVDDKRAESGYSAHPDVPRFKDFRVMLDKLHKEIDVVLISTPDHTHFPAAMASMELGKHIFVQKPLTHDIWQARTLQKAAKYYKVQTVMGNQGHCGSGIRQIKEWYDAGLLGEVEEIHAWVNRPFESWYPKHGYPPKEAPIPDTLDWDTWLGPASQRAYTDCYIPGKWRIWWDFGIGGLGDIGCHLLDGPFWALNLTGPVSVKAEAEHFHDQLSPKRGIITYNFPANGNRAPLTMRWYEGGNKPPKPENFDFGETLPDCGILIKGTKNALYHPSIRPANPLILMSRKEWSEFRKTSLPAQTIPRLKPGCGPVEELYDAIKGGPQPGSNFDYAAPLTEMCNLGAVALRTGKQLDYDPATMSFKDASLNRYIKDPVRKGWAYGDNLWS